MLKPRKRLVRAKIKEDKFVIYTARVQAFLSRNSRQLLYGFVLVIVILAIGIGVGWSRSAAGKHAAFASLLARDAYSRGDLDGTLTHANIILEDYSGTKYAAVAGMLKGRVHEHRGELSLAIDAYRKLIGSSGDQKYLAFGAYYSLGSIYYGQGEYEEAARFFIDGATRYPHNFNAAYSLLEAAHSLKQLKKYEQARKVLMRIMSEYPKSRATDEARRELEEIVFMP